MTTTVVGLFPSQENAKKLTEGLENSGFLYSDYIVYTYNKETPKKNSIWSKLFRNSDEKITDDHLITSIAIQNDTQLQNVKNTFKKNDVVQVYEFQDMTLEEAKDLNFIKKMVELRAKSQIYAMPEISTMQTEINIGINTEVKA